MDLDIQLDRSSRARLPHQIGSAIIDLIGRGALSPRNRLPATRNLAQQLSVSRMTIVEAYGWLEDQGYVEAHRGSGTIVRNVRVSNSVPIITGMKPFNGSAAPVEERPAIEFKPGLPDLSEFPRRQWSHAVTRSIRELPDSALGYGDPLGYPRLRAAISAYLNRGRGLAVSPDNVIITLGAAQAVDILLRVLPPPAEIVLEFPGPAELRTLPAVYGVPLREVPIDDQGLRTDLLPENDGRSRIAYIMPSHQFPIGCAMSIERRQALISWAVRSNAYVIEDDYDSEFAYNGRPAIPLTRLDSDGRVIYTGTFSKTMAPALRIGFMVVPDHLLAKIRQLKLWADRGGWTLQQNALAELIENGTFERHVHRMRLVYKARFLALSDELQTRLGERVKIIGQPVGMHFLVAVETDLSPEEMRARALGRGVGISFLKENLPNLSSAWKCFIFGFGNVKGSDIRQGAKTFADIVLGL